MVPAPEIVLVVPPMVIVPALAIKLPATLRFPVRIIDEAVVTVPVMLRLSGEMSVPLIVVPVPLMVKVPPEACVKDPAPVVAKFPVKLKPSAEKATIAAAMLRLLKFCVPAPLTVDPAPVKTTVPVFPLKTPAFAQFAPIFWVKLPPLKVVAAPMETFPFTVNVAAAVKLTEVPAPWMLLRFPNIVIAVAGNVLTAAPEELLSFKFP